eukprot:gene21193-23923_t
MPVGRKGHGWEQLLIRGVGYSPTPPGHEVADFFGPEHEWLWARDVARMRDMGANVVRLWVWDWARVDHTPFLDLLAVYADLTDPATRGRLLGDWGVFVRRNKNHAAVLGFL